MNFGRMVKAIRAWRGMEQRELAPLIGIERSTLSRIETGLVLPGSDLEERIKKALRWEEALEEMALGVPERDS